MEQEAHRERGEHKVRTIIGAHVTRLDMEQVEGEKEMNVSNRKGGECVANEDHSLISSTDLAAGRDFAMPENISTVSSDLNRDPRRSGK